MDFPLAIRVLEGENDVYLDEMFGGYWIEVIYDRIIYVDKYLKYSMFLTLYNIYTRG